MRKFIETPKNKNLIYDVGMHKGEDSEFYLRKGFRVIAFEADPTLVLFSMNRLREFIDTGQLTIIEGAIIDLEEIDAGQKKVQFYKNNNVSVYGTVCSNWADRNVRLGASSKTIEVDVIDFAAIIQEYGIPHFMKISRGSRLVPS